MTSEQKLLIDTVSASVTGYKAVLESEPNWEIFLILARIHKIEALIYDGLQKSHIALPEAIQQHLSSAYMQAIFTDAQMEYRKEDVNMGVASMSEYEIWRTSSSRVAAAKNVLDKIRDEK